MRYFSLPMTSVPKPNFKTIVRRKMAITNDAVKTLNIAGYCRGSFSLSHVCDAFLVTLGWGKGTVWVNGHHLGRFWAIGPQQSLYVPCAWLKLGRNEVVLFDLDTSARETLSGSPGPYIE
ncbi:MAG: hypothetical protein ABJC26_13990 [Gemmatimonadaceae bacterium]